MHMPTPPHAHMPTHPHMRTYPHIYTSTHLPIHPSYPFIYLLIYLYTPPVIHPFCHSSPHPFMHPSVDPSMIHPLTPPPSPHPFLLHPSIYLPIPKYPSQPMNHTVSSARYPLFQGNKVQEPNPWESPPASPYPLTTV